MTVGHKLALSFGGDRVARTPLSDSGLAGALVLAATWQGYRNSSVWLDDR
jgi:pyruvate/2-oxoglutarate/acetoin dehydrogenase E1 component